MTFKTVFDAGQQGYPTAWLNGLFFVAAGVLLVFRPALMQRLTPWGLQGKARVVITWIFLLSAVISTAVSFFNSRQNYREVVYELSTGRYSTVEGPVADFIPMPYTGHSKESFTVNGRHFSYSDYISTSGFHNTASHGGPIREDLFVRIAYSGNLILRLEVAQ